MNIQVNGSGAERHFRFLPCVLKLTLKRLIKCHQAEEYQSKLGVLNARGVKATWPHLCENINRRLARAPASLVTEILRS